MLKFLLIIALILYSVYKIGSLFFRAGAASQQFRNPRKPFNDHVNGNASKNGKKHSNFKGGEYVDFEEIK